ncbi:hypothetical protein VPMG_00085 [Vibrio phage VBP32]|uniref:HNH nuclease domain-containing protein n=2 Tax=Stoningtonvirus VBP47 TaxID=2846606 RepID=M4SM22_9CAUD|nr:HNH endonuclease [Vibrio phage VBP47]YP_007676575.1 HNH endonuclease [Vibrio phage VBP32]AGH57068.1 hypothetical protein VPNG_00044 [Vibrio phage VBP47]AGH57224.1 hypothetical protein VPMG_00085 [Vibrio phage VBP32]
MTYTTQLPRPKCECGNLCKKGGKSVEGFQLYRSKCSPCLNKVEKQGKATRNNRRYVNAQHKEECCSRCGFLPEHPCQLDVDHIDGNPNNYAEDNIQTLCANCHRLKTYQNKDWESPSLKS